MAESVKDRQFLFLEVVGGGSLWFAAQEGQIYDEEQNGGYGVAEVEREDLFFGCLTGAVFLNYKGGQGKTDSCADDA